MLNKVLPAYLRDQAATEVAQRLCADGPAIAARLGEAGEPEQVQRVLKEIGESFMNFQVVAKSEAERRMELSSVPDVVATVPYFDSDIYDLSGLLDLGRAIWS